VLRTFNLRDNLCVVVLSLAALTGAAVGSVLDPIRDVSDRPCLVGCCRLSRAMELSALQPLTRLVMLDMSRNCLAGALHFPALPCLRVLRLQHNQLSVLPDVHRCVQLQVRLPTSLQPVRLCWPQHSALTPHAMFLHQELNLNHNAITEVDSASRALPGRSLKALHLSGNQLLHLVSLQRLASCRGLTTLDVHDNFFELELFDAHALCVLCASTQTCLHAVLALEEMGLTACVVWRLSHTLRGCCRYAPFMMWLLPHLEELNGHEVGEALMAAAKLAFHDINDAVVRCAERFHALCYLLRAWSALTYCLCPPPCACFLFSVWQPPG